MLYRQPHTMEIVPSFTCVNIHLKDIEDSLDLILDGDNVVVLEVDGNFFEIERAGENNFFYTKIY